MTARDIASSPLRQIATIVEMSACAAEDLPLEGLAAVDSFDETAEDLAEAVAPDPDAEVGGDAVAKLPCKTVAMDVAPEGVTVPLSASTFTTPDVDERE